MVSGRGIVRAWYGGSNEARATSLDTARVALFGFVIDELSD